MSNPSASRDDVVLSGFSELLSEYYAVRIVSVPASNDSDIPDPVYEKDLMTAFEAVKKLYASGYRLTEIEADSFNRFPNNRKRIKGLLDPRNVDPTDINWVEFLVAMYCPSHPDRENSEKEEQCSFLSVNHTPTDSEGRPRPSLHRRSSSYRSVASNEEMEGAEKILKRAERLENFVESAIEWTRQADEMTSPSNEAAAENLKKLTKTWDSFYGDHLSQVPTRSGP